MRICATVTDPGFGAATGSSEGVFARATFDRASQLRDSTQRPRKRTTTARRITTILSESSGGKKYAAIELERKSRQVT